VGDFVGSTDIARNRALRSDGGSLNSLGDILERVLDKGLVIAGEIRVNLVDIELLTIKLRLVVASLETAKELGIDWWESDPWLNAKAAVDASDRDELQRQNRELRERISEMETALDRKEGENRD
jgi:Gas vesicle protein